MAISDLFRGCRIRYACSSIVVRKSMSRPLAGIRVVELCTMITGPLTGMLLADLGADVIKVEPPKTGDPFRKHGGNFYSAYFCTYDRNKRSIVLDLKSPCSLSCFQALIRSADILVENFRPGVMERLGLSSGQLHAVNPRLIHCSITGFGRDGPYAGRPAYDAVAQAQSGCMSLFVDERRPEPFGPTLSDNLAGFYGCYGIFGALFERQRTGRGRRVDVNMIESTMAFFSSAFSIYKMEGLVQKPDSRVRSSQSYLLKTADSVSIAVHLSSSQKFWLALLDALRSSDLENDSRFSSYDSRIERYHELGDELRHAASALSSDELLARLELSGVPFARVNSIPDVFEDAQVRFLDSFYEIDHPVAGKVHGVMCPVLYDGKRDKEILPPPLLGEHTREVLAEIGCDQVQIDEILASA
jgi:crotonobetainyl-CoA:carnitine CoA-transferase CaiB-like acyl-CoA transferase